MSATLLQEDPCCVSISYWSVFKEVFSMTRTSTTYACGFLLAGEVGEFDVNVRRRITKYELAMEMQIMHTA
jgi:hypothetical protein